MCRPGIWLSIILWRGGESLSACTVLCCTVCIDHQQMGLPDTVCCGLFHVVGQQLEREREKEIHVKATSRGPWPILWDEGFLCLVCRSGLAEVSGSSFHNIQSCSSSPVQAAAPASSQGNSLSSSLHDPTHLFPKCWRFENPVSHCLDPLCLCVCVC